MTGILALLLTLFVIVVIVGVLFWCVDAFPFGTVQMKQIAKIILVIGGLIVFFQNPHLMGSIL
jgi:hypothetical protein